MAMNRKAKRLRLELTLEENIRLICTSEQNSRLTQKELGDEFGIGRSTVSDILRKKTAYKSQWESNRGSDKRRLNKPTKMSSLNSLTYEYLLMCHPSLSKRMCGSPD